jgi:DNA repair exonuclease SbcCD ATPase subunit
MFDESKYDAQNDAETRFNNVLEAFCPEEHCLELRMKCQALQEKRNTIKTEKNKLEAEKQRLETNIASLHYEIHQTEKQLMDSLSEVKVLQNTIDALCVLDKESPDMDVTEIYALSKSEFYEIVAQMPSWVDLTRICREVIHIKQKYPTWTLDAFQVIAVSSSASIQTHSYQFKDNDGTVIQYKPCTPTKMQE